MPTLDELVAAWPEILAGFKPSLSAMYADGRFTEVAAGHVVLSMPSGNVIAGEPRRPEVEAALSRRFGRPVPLRLAADASGRSEAGARAPGAGAAGGPAEDDDDVGDVHELENAPDAATGAARLAEAFPGAELVEEP